MTDRTLRSGADAGFMRCRGNEFRWGERTYVMGIINVTPDSFSGDGLGGDLEAAVARGKRFAAEGADMIDIGGESTRPGAVSVSLEEELGRVIPVVERLSREVTVPISVDSYRYEVARRAIAAGASMLNDIWGLMAEPRLADLAAEHGVPLILMSNQRNEPSPDIVPTVIAGLRKSIALALSREVPWQNLIIDPGIGIGFGKTLEQNLELVRRLNELKCLGRPVLIGTSRKSMIGLVLNQPIDQRLEGTAATVAISIAGGANIVRVHDVAQMVRVCRMTDALVRSHPR